MKKILSILIAVMLIVCVLPLNAFASGGMSVSTGSLSLEPGKTATFTVSASNAAGQISVSSSNPSVATASLSTDFIDNDSATVTVKAVGSGSANITVNAVDMATYDEENISGQARSVSINVAAPATTKAPVAVDTTAPATNEKTTEAPTADTGVQLDSLKVIAGDVVTPVLIPGIYDYVITVPYGSKTVIVDPVLDGAEDIQVLGADEISDGSKVMIVATTKDGTATYTLTVKYADPEVKEVKADNDGISKGLAIIIGIALFVIGLIIGLILGLIIGKKKYETVDYYSGDDNNNSTPIIPGTDYDEDASAPFAVSGLNFASTGMGFNYDFAENNYDGFDETPSLRDPVYTETQEADPEPAPVEPAPAAFEYSTAQVAEPATAPVAEPVPVAAPIPAVAPAVEPVAEPAPAAPVYEAPAPAEPVATPMAYAQAPDMATEPVIAAPVAEPAPVAPVYAAPVAEPTPAAPVYAAPVAEPAPAAPVYAAPVAEPAPAPAPTIEMTPEPIAQPYIDDAPPVLPYEAGKALGVNPFEES